MSSLSVTYALPIIHIPAGNCFCPFLIPKRGPGTVITLQVAALNLVTALACGAVIGLQRQVRGLQRQVQQRMAGLRIRADHVQSESD